MIPLNHKFDGFAYHSRLLSKENKKVKENKFSSHFGIYSTKVMLALLLIFVSVVISQAQSAKEMVISIRSFSDDGAVRNQFLQSEQGGGTWMKTSPSRTSNFWKFTLVDANGGELMSGDLIYLRTPQNMYLRNLNGVIDAKITDSGVGANNGQGEFIITNLSRPGQAISYDDLIAIMSKQNNTWLIASAGDDGKVKTQTMSSGLLPRGYWQLCNPDSPQNCKQYNSDIYYTVPRPNRQNERLISIRSWSDNAQIFDKFLQAENGGGRWINIHQTRDRNYWTFILVDANEGSLIPGDTVYFRTASNMYLRNVDGVLKADVTVPTESGKFTITNLTRPGRAIEYDDLIALKTLDGKAWTANSLDEAKVKVENVTQSGLQRRNYFEICNPLALDRCKNWNPNNVPPPPPNTGGTGSGGSAIEITTICAGQVPTGWIKIDDDWNPLRCGNPTSISYNVWTIARYDKQPVGMVMRVCAGVVPSGWVKIDSSWNPQDCGHPTRISDNVMTIRRTN